MKKSNICPLCDKPMESLLSLPNFPLTEMYEPVETPFIQGRGFVDQAFLYCEPCNHGKLETIVPPETLYGHGYRTKTAKSQGAVQAVINFSEFIKSNCDLSQIDTVVDIGANDATLIRQFKHKRLIAVDPNAGDEEESIKSFIEDADLSRVKDHRKLILSSHTIEHLERPEVMLQKIMETLCYGDIVALQFPSLELLVRDRRIDQIHHQHVHYFSQKSISKLLARFGLEITHYQLDESHWGALMVIARRGAGEVSGMNISSGSICWEIDDFKHDIFSALIPKGSIALGASLMFPVLDYWLPLGLVDCIADDDKNKNGFRYINFNKPITNEYSLKGRDVVITAIGTKAACRSLVTKAFNEGARNVIVPLHTL